MSQKFVQKVLSYFLTALYPHQFCWITYKSLPSVALLFTKEKESYTKYKNNLVLKKKKMETKNTFPEIRLII